MASPLASLLGPGLGLGSPVAEAPQTNPAPSCASSDGRYYEIVKANFERADRNTVVRTSTSSRVSNYYLLGNYKDLVFN